MSKRKKKAPLRSDFTDALQVEIDERKIVERTQPKEEIFQKSVTLEKAVEVEKIEVAPLEKILVETKIEIEKIEVPPTIEVKPETKLEERILKEADNTFFDEKPAPKKVAEEKPSPRKSIYHSKALKKWAAEQEEEKISSPQIELPKIEMPRKLSHAEKFGVVASVAMLIYAFVNMDKPLFFLALSLFIHFLSMPAGNIFGKHSAAVQNALRTFSIVLFCGAILFLFM